MSSMSRGRSAYSLWMTRSSAVANRTGQPVSVRSSAHPVDLARVHPQCQIHIFGHPQSPVNQHGLPADIMYGIMASSSARASRARSRSNRVMVVPAHSVCVPFQFPLRLPPTNHRRQRRHTPGHEARALHKPARLLRTTTTSLAVLHIAAQIHATPFRLEPSF